MPLQVRLYIGLNIWTAVESLQEKSLDSLNPSTCSLLVPFPSWEKRFTPVVGKFGQNKHSGCTGIKGGKVTYSKNSWPTMPPGNKTSEEKSSDSVPFQRRLEWVTEAIRGQETQETVSSAHSPWGTAQASWRYRSWGGPIQDHLAGHPLGAGLIGAARLVGRHSQGRKHSSQVSVCTNDVKIRSPCSLMSRGASECFTPTYVHATVITRHLRKFLTRKRRN